MVQGSIEGLYYFDCNDSLHNHPSDNANGHGIVLQMRCFHLRKDVTHSFTASDPQISPPATTLRSPHADPNILLEKERGASKSPESHRSLPIVDQEADTRQLEMNVGEDAQSKMSFGSEGNPQLTLSDRSPLGSSDIELDMNPDVSRNEEFSDQGDPSHDDRNKLNSRNLGFNDLTGILQSTGQIPTSTKIPELLPWMVKNKRWIELFYKHALKETFLDEALDILGAPCKQWKTIMANISHLSGLKESMQCFATYPGHMAFVADPSESDTPEKCTYCGKAAPQSPDAENTYVYFPILPRLRQILRREKTCDELYAYRKARLHDPGISRDFFDGALYQEVLEMYGGECAIRNDVFIVASADGFSPFKNRNYDMWSIAAINLNLAPHQRYKPQNVLPLAFIPGPNQPKNMQFFLLPLVTEMLQTKDGVNMDFPDGSQRLVRIHLVGFTGDQPALCKVSGLIGHNGKSPCRDCEIHGYFSNHYYFPSIQTLLELKSCSTQGNSLWEMNVLYEIQ